MNDFSRDDDHRDQPAQRWRRSEERYRRESQSGRSPDDGNDASRYGREGGSGFGDQPYAGSGQDGGYGGRRDQARGGYGQRGQAGGYAGGDQGSGRGYAAQDHGYRQAQAAREYADDRGYEPRSGQSYGGGYAVSDDAGYSTGQQGGWSGGGSYGARSRGGSGRGRDQGYGSRGDGRPEQQRGFWDRATDEVASWFGDDDASRRREEDHRGRGPKDYKRSDERIREDANDRLTEDWRVDASNVTVAVQDGELTLDGTVTSREAKRRAEDVVDSLSGVKHVQNNLRVAAASADQSGNHAAGSAWTRDRDSSAEGGTTGG